MLGMETGAADCGPDSATATRTAPSGVQALLSFVSRLFPPFIPLLSPVIRGGQHLVGADPPRLGGQVPALDPHGLIYSRTSKDR